MRKEIEALKARLARLESKRAQARRLRRLVPAAAVQAGTRPRSWKLPGTNTSMRIGGFAQLDLIYDINHSSGDSLSGNAASPTSFPSSGTAAANRQGNFRLHARKSRVFIRTWTPTDLGLLATRIEGDFFGAGGNQLISNSNSFRLRHAYGSLGPVLAGQTNSNYRFTEFEPRVFELRGPAGKGDGRQGIIAYTHSLGGGTQLRLSVENPETGRAAVATSFVTPVVISAGGANDPLPDLTISLRHRWKNGIVRVGAIGGVKSLDDGFGTSGSTGFWGVQGGLLYSFGKRNKVGVLGFFGYGTGPHFRGQPAEIAVTGVNGGNISVRAVRNYGGYAWIRRQWTDKIQTNLMYGRHDGDVEQRIPKALIPAGTTDIHWSLIANIVYRPVNSVDFALEFHLHKSQFHNARESTVKRIQVSFRYDF